MKQPVGIDPCWTNQLLGIARFSSSFETNANVNERPWENLFPLFVHHIKHFKLFIGPPREYPLSCSFNWIFFFLFLFLFGVASRNLPWCAKDFCGLCEIASSPVTTVRKNKLFKKKQTYFFPLLHTSLFSRSAIWIIVPLVFILIFCFIFISQSAFVSWPETTCTASRKVPKPVWLKWATSCSRYTNAI